MERIYMSVKKNVLRGLVAVLMAIGLIGGHAVTANAVALYSFSGTTNTGGYVVNYSVWRLHSRTGDIVGMVTNHVTNGGTYTPRAESGRTLAWTSMYVTNAYWGAGAGWYALSAKQNSCSTWQKMVTGCDNQWGGTLAM